MGSEITFCVAELSLYLPCQVSLPRGTLAPWAEAHGVLLALFPQGQASAQVLPLCRCARGAAVPPLCVWDHADQFSAYSTGERASEE